MLAKIVLLFAAAATAATAASAGFTIPADQPDGVYNVFFDDAGESTHVFVSPINASATAAIDTSAEQKARRSNRPNKRDQYHLVTCQNYPMTDHGDARSAYHNLQDKCGSGFLVPGQSDRRGAVYVKKDDAVTFYCNNRPNGESNYCYRDELIESIQTYVDHSCGSYQAGYDRRADRGCEYGQDSWAKNSRFCGYQQTGDH